MARRTKKQKTHQEPEEEDEHNDLAAEMPKFTVVTQPIVASKPGASAKSKSKSKTKASTGQIDGDLGTFRSGFHKSLDVRYVVTLDRQMGQWEKIGRTYNAFQPEDSNLANSTGKKHKIEKGECVAICGLNEEDPDAQDGELEYDWWYAEVIEIRAANPQHVYLLVSWLYRPHDLKNGRQDYHAENEVFPSNHLQVIAATTAESKVIVRKWEKADQLAIDQEQREVEENGETFLVWRQTVNTVGGKQTLSSKPDLECVCKKPANPDERLTECNHCERWMHKSCLESKAMTDFSAGKFSKVKPEPTTGKVPSALSDIDDTTIKLAPISQHPGLLSRLMSPFKKTQAESNGVSNLEATLASEDVPIETVETKDESTTSSKRKRDPAVYNPNLGSRNKSSSKAKAKAKDVDARDCATVQAEPGTAYIAKVKPALHGAASVEIYEDTEDGPLTASAPLQCLFADCKKTVSWKNESEDELQEEP